MNRNFEVELRMTREIYIQDPFDGDGISHEMQAWMDEFTAGKWAWSPIFAPAPPRMRFFFECLEDAVAFKLRWY